MRVIEPRLSRKEWGSGSDADTKHLSGHCYSYLDFMDLPKLGDDDLHFLQMDVEGFEFEILPTIHDLLEKERTSFMFIEHNQGGTWTCREIHFRTWGVGLQVPSGHKGIQ